MAVLPWSGGSTISTAANTLIKLSAAVQACGKGSLMAWMEEYELHLLW